MAFSTSINSDAIVKHLLAKYPFIKPYRVELCGRADDEHLKDNTVYAHVFHRHNVICVAGEIESLKFGHKIGVLLVTIAQGMSGRGKYDLLPKARKWILHNIGIEFEMRDGLPYVKRNKVGL